MFDGSDVAGLESERAAVWIRLQELTERVFLLAAASLVTSSETVQLIFLWKVFRFGQGMQNAAVSLVTFSLRDNICKKGEMK